MKIKRFFQVVIGSILLTACASIVNKNTIPLSVAFSDGSIGECKFSNKKASYDFPVPSIQMVRRARSALNYECLTDSKKASSGSIPSTIEAEKFAASVLFLDLGITDSITEKARFYPQNNIIPVPTTATFEKGLVAFKRQKYKTALGQFTPLAQNGIASAQNYLGIMYSRGNGVPKDYAKALKWYKLAAAQNHPGAQFNLGSMYHFERGVSQSFKKAAKWYKLSAAQEFAAAQHYLAHLYHQGTGVGRNYAKALELYRLSADQNYTLAQYN